MMTLGDYRFSVDTAAYQQLQRTTEYRWSQQDRIGRNPSQQYIGPGTDTINLSGVIYPRYRGGLGQIELMKKEAAKGESLLLTDGLGVVHGDWVIKQISETNTNFIEGGVALKTEFSLQLLAYGEDE